MLNSRTATAQEIERIAERCHEANRQFRRRIGEAPGNRWNDLPVAEPKQQESIIEGVKRTLDGSTPEQNHEGWLAFKKADGWTWGEEKDVNKKTHPQLVPYDELPDEQKEKDALFQRSVANGVKEALRARRAALAAVFTHQTPDDTQIPRYKAIRDAGLALAETIVELTPVSADQSAAIRKVREAVMTANAAIALENVNAS